LNSIYLICREARIGGKVLCGWDSPEIIDWDVLVAIILKIVENRFMRNLNSIFLIFTVRKMCRWKCVIYWSTYLRESLFQMMDVVSYKNRNIFNREDSAACIALQTYKVHNWYKLSVILGGKTKASLIVKYFYSLFLAFFYCNMKRSLSFLLPHRHFFLFNKAFFIKNFFEVSNWEKYAFLTTY